jgi:hypothetical protein
MNQRKRAAPPQNGPIRNATNGNDLTLPWQQDPHEALTAEDRADFDVIIAAAERGFRLATRCVDCGHWLAAPSSVSAHRGPRCRAKTGR